MTKLIKLPLVVLLAGSVSACDATGDDKPKTSQRDVYNSMEDCIADWGDSDLCEREMKEAREHQLKMAEAQAKAGGGAAIMPIPMFFGPTYYGDSRSVSHNGRTIAPESSRATRTANYTTTAYGGRSIAYTPPRPPTPTAMPSSVISRSNGINVSTPSTSVSRGGFGSSGAASSGG